MRQAHEAHLARRAGRPPTRARRCRTGARPRGRARARARRTCPAAAAAAESVSAKANRSGADAQRARRRPCRWRHRTPGVPSARTMPTSTTGARPSGEIDLAAHVERAALREQRRPARSSERLHRIDAGGGRAWSPRSAASRRADFSSWNARYACVTSAAAPYRSTRPSFSHSACAAQLLDVVHAVRAQQQRAAAGEIALHPGDAFLLERFVADGEHLVGDQDVRRERGRDREAQAHDHARRVVLDRVVDVIADVGERDDLVALGGDLGAARARAARRRDRCWRAPCTRDGSPSPARAARRRGR